MVTTVPCSARSARSAITYKRNALYVKVYVSKSERGCTISTHFPLTQSWVSNVLWQTGRGCDTGAGLPRGKFGCWSHAYLDLKNSLGLCRNAKIVGRMIQVWLGKMRLRSYWHGKKDMARLRELAPRPGRWITKPSLFLFWHVSSARSSVLQCIKM